MNRLMLLAAVGAVVGLGACDRSTTQSETRTETDSGKALRTGTIGNHVVPVLCGPKAGPIVVAVVKAQREERSQHDLFDDMKDLVERNVGG